MASHWRAETCLAGLLLTLRDSSRTVAGPSWLGAGLGAGSWVTLADCSGGVRCAGGAGGAGSISTIRLSCAFWQGRLEYVTLPCASMHLFRLAAWPLTASNRVATPVHTVAHRMA